MNRDDKVLRSHDTIVHESAQFARASDCTVMAAACLFSGTTECSGAAVAIAVTDVWQAVSQAVGRLAEDLVRRSLRPYAQCHTTSLENMVHQVSVHPRGCARLNRDPPLQKRLMRILQSAAL